MVEKTTGVGYSVIQTISSWNFQFYVNLLFSQLSPYRPTMYQTYVVGLNGQASDIVVYDGADCSDLGNVHGCHERLPLPTLPQVTSIL